MYNGIDTRVGLSELTNRVFDFFDYIKLTYIHVLQCSRSLWIDQWQGWHEMQPWFIILTQPYITKQGYWMPKDIPIHENLPYKIYKIHFIFTYDDEPHRLHYWDTYDTRIIQWQNLVQAIFLAYTLVSINVCAIFTYTFDGYPCRYKLGQFRMHWGKIMGLISSEIAKRMIAQNAIIDHKDIYCSKWYIGFLLPMLFEY